MPGKAIDRLTGAGLAPDTQDTFDKIKSKFVDPPPGQARSLRPPAPEANELSQAIVSRAILSFKRGLGGGPTGARPDFIRQIISEKGDSPGVAIITNLCNVLANGKAPAALRPYIGGACGFGLNKDAKIAVAEAAEASANSFQGSDGDVRPVCCGEVWRRIVGKALLATEAQNLKDHLYPHQLAVAVKSGSECMAHLGRQWFQQHEGNTDKILVDFDQSNAHNTADRHTFLQRSHEVIPGASRWLEYIYPTDEPTLVFCRGRPAIQSRAGGQQGCPMMTTAHALVQRIFHESLGLAEIDPRTTQMAPILDPKPTLDMAPGFADDGFFAGSSQDVARSVRHVKSIMHRFGVSFSRLEAIPAAGSRSTIDMQQFLDIGCAANMRANVAIMKSPVGSLEFCEEDVESRVGKSIRILEAIAKLPDQHSALYLLRFQLGRMDYLVRTTPSSHCSRALEKFDLAVKQTYESITGLHVTKEQWTEGCLPVKYGGLGARSVLSYADAAYYSSRAATWERCESIYPAYGQLMEDCVRDAESRLDSSWQGGYQVPTLPTEDTIPSQQWIVHKTSAALVMQLKQQLPHFDRARLTAHASPMSGRWLAATPSPAMGTHMSGIEVSVSSCMRLGIDVMKGGGPCRFCGDVLDSKGVHAASCMSGGDVALRHNRVRNIIYHFSCRAQLNAELEKAGVLDEDGVFVDLCRPADIMIDGSTAATTVPERLALDVKVINSLGQGHFQDTLQGPLVAAEKYRDASTVRNNVRARCAAKGVRYEPLVFTTQGACERRAEAIISQIADKVAQVEGRDPAKVKAELFESLSMSIARSVAKAVVRRRPRPRLQMCSQTGTLVDELECLHESEDFP